MILIDLCDEQKLPDAMKTAWKDLKEDERDAAIKLGWVTIDRTASSRAIHEMANECEARWDAAAAAEQLLSTPSSSSGAAAVDEPERGVSPYLPGRWRRERIKVKLETEMMSVKLEGAMREVHRVQFTQVSASIRWLAVDNCGQLSIATCYVSVP